jgi:penicillin-binding protein 1B
MQLSARRSTCGSSAPTRWPEFGIFPGLPRLEAAFLAVELLIVLTGICLFVYFSRELKGFTDARLLEGGGVGGPAVILASPAQVWVGQEATPAALAARLRNALYVDGKASSAVGTFKLAGDSLDIHPGTASFFRHAQIREGAAELKFQSGRITTIKSLDDNTALQSYWLEPEVITTLSGYDRSEERLVRYQDVPKVLRDAVIATEDHRFFSHHGVNLTSIFRAIRVDLRGDGKLQGGSTLTMQLARNLFLTPHRIIRRKVEEICLALFLEMRLSKQQIFELYANRVYLGQQGNFGIFGFGDAAQAYFHKDVGKLSLPEAAFLAGLVSGPNLYSPYKYPQRALERRNFVLRQMVATGFIKPADAESAMAVPLKPVEPTIVETRQEAFFEDMVTRELRTQFSEPELRFRGLRVYTSLDLDLQRAASEATRVGSKELDQHLRKPKPSKHANSTDSNQPQLALVALDPHTGDVKALIGGRDYGTSQLNHVMARRQPGSSFKPFVYAAALNSGVDGSTPVITPATLLNDEPTQFRFGNAWDKPYEPKDYKESYHGTVTVREALMDSLNVPTVSLAQKIGYGKVRDLAIAAGFNSQLEATPSLALGAYVATPMEVAGAYTIFANQGQYVAPRCIVEVDDASGSVVWARPATPHRVLDPRVSYLMVSLLESVINGGTGAAVRARGFELPAAGKTGTSHDGWFAGFTSNLLAVVWVGYDDDRELNLTGAESALPFWTEFMKRATSQPSYRNAQPFTAPPGIVTVPIETEASSADSADLDSLATRTEVFIQGTQPAAPDQGAPSAELAAAQGGSAPDVESTDETQPSDVSHDPPATDAPVLAGSLAAPAAPTTAALVPRSSVESLPLGMSRPPVPSAGDNPPGRLRVQTDPPGLEVLIDGKSVGLSPVTLSLSAGEHTYKVVPPSDKAPTERQVQIKSGGALTVNVHY